MYVLWGGVVLAVMFSCGIVWYVIWITGYGGLAGRHLMGILC